MPSYWPLTDAAGGPMLIFTQHIAASFDATGNAFVGQVFTIGGVARLQQSARN